MARGTSTKLLATLPDSYRANFVERLDKRTRVARAILDRIAVLESDAGGAENLAHARRSLIRRAAWLEAICEVKELALADGQPLDVGGYTQALNSLLGVYRLLGIERRQKSAKRLRDALEGVGVPPAGGTPARGSHRTTERGSHP